MNSYALLLLPAANRVYAASAADLLQRELEITAARAVDQRVHDIGRRSIGGVDYVVFATDEPLDDTAVAALSNMSSLYALFERLDDADTGALRPITLAPLDRFDSDLLTIQRYAGKTNERFTKLLMNLTCLALDDPRAMLHRRLRLLDPLCGRGTTLNQAMMYGFDAAGIEAGRRDFDEYERFVKTWLRDKRLKHTAQSGQLRKDKVKLGRRLDVEYAATKEDFRAGDTATIAFREADTLRTAELFAPRSFDVVMTDAPYGVQHGSRRGSELERNPSELLASAIDGWTRVLRPGGAFGLSFNRKVLPRDEAAANLADAGLAVCAGGPYEQLAHRVDHAITRDVLIASKPSG